MHWRAHARRDSSRAPLQQSPHIERCLRSIQAQSFADFETVVVDDGSTDHSSDVALRAVGGDSRFRIIVQTNRERGPHVIAELRKPAAALSPFWTPMMNGNPVFWKPLRTLRTSFRKPASWLPASEPAVWMGRILKLRSTGLAAN